MFLSHPAAEVWIFLATPCLGLTAISMLPAVTPIPCSGITARPEPLSTNSSLPEVENLQNPRGLLFSDDGFLYVASVDGDDATQGTGDAILRYDASTGAFESTFVSPGSGGLDNPIHMAFGPDDNLYVSSSSSTSNAVLRYDGSSGTFIDTFIASGSGGLDGPVDLLFHTDGFLYVSSCAVTMFFDMTVRLAPMSTHQLTHPVEN